MDKKVNVQDQISRMKSLMGYGLQTESKTPQYSSVEHYKLAADGKVYGIVREGAKYYIETAENKKSLVKEDFNYIGGFKNRKDFEYSSFAMAQKNFDLKIRSINEAYSNGKNIVVESWNPNTKENLSVEATEKMRKEIMRERQIMENAARISERKEQTPKSCCACGSANCECEDPSKSKNIEGFENLKDVNPLNSFTKKNPERGNAKKANEHEDIKENAEPLAWHEKGGDANETMNDDYVDNETDTEVGDSSPFEETVVEENIDDIFNSNTSEDDDDVEGEEDDNLEPEAVEDEVELETVEDDDDGEFGNGLDDLDGETTEDEDDEDEGEPFDADDLTMRVENMEDMLTQIASKLGIDIDDIDTEDYEDDEDLYGDDETEEGDEDDDVEDDDDMKMESRNYDNVQIFESKNFKKKYGHLKENENEFGKHPAYQKEPMTVPTNKHKELDGYHDMNDDSVEGEEPFGKEVGDGAPFEIDAKTLEAAITEAIKRSGLLNKKKV